MQISEWPWIKILGTICGVLIAVAEIWEYSRRRKNRKWLKLKKPVMLGLIAALLCLSLWDNVQEESKSIAQEKARDTLIIKDSIRINNLFKRTDTILNSVGTAVRGIEDSKSSLLLLDSLLVTLNKRLDTALTKTNELDRKRFELDRPFVQAYSSNTEVSLDQSNNIERISYHFANYGKRDADNNKNATLSIFLDNSLHKLSFITDDGKVPDGVFRESTSIPNSSSGLWILSRNLDFPVSKILNTKNILFGVTIVSYKDFATGKEYEENFFFRTWSTDSGTFAHAEASSEEKKVLLDFIYRENYGSHITKDNLKKYLNK